MIRRWHSPVSRTGRGRCLFQQVGPRWTLTPVSPDADLVRDNPLGKIPCLIIDDGMALYDSRVICEYLDGLHDGPRMFPA